MPPKRRRFVQRNSRISANLVFITFAQYCIYRVIRQPFWSHDSGKNNWQKTVVAKYRERLIFGGVKTISENDLI